eukprot:g25820.t1
MTTATSMDVQVEDPELRASGTFSWRYVLSSKLGRPGPAGPAGRMALLFLWHVLRWGISIHLEQAAALPGHLGPPWWRGVLVAFNGAVFCVWGLFHTWAASLSGEVGSTGLQKLVPICMAIPPMLPMGTWVQLADFPLSLFGLSILFLFGPTLQYYQTQQQHPARRLLPCLVWTIAQLAGTVGISAILAVIVVAYRLLLVSQPVLASFFLPVCTAVVETGGVMYTKILYAKLVVQKRPMVPGDISWVAMPYMMCSAHAFSEAARLAAVFSGAVSTGDYGWVASLAVTLSLNILVRSGWMRYGCYVLVRKIGGSKRAMWMLAPTAWNKLHDEMKIYAGYFRFIVVLALVAARAVLFQEISLSSSRAAAFNMSAALALIAMLLVEYLEDHIVLRELLPTSPVISEFVEHESWQNAPGIELGLHVEAVSSNGKTPVPCSTLLPVPGEHLEKAEGFHRASSPASTGRNSELCGPSRSPKRATGGSHQRAESVGSEEDKQRMFSVILPLQCEHAENAEDDECSILAEPAASARSNNSDGREHSQFLHTATVLGLRMESVGSEGGETPKFSAILPLPGEHLEQAEEAEEVQTLPARVAAPLPEPKLLDFATPMTSQASMGQRRSSLPSRLRRWFGQERQVVPMLQESENTLKTTFFHKCSAHVTPPFVPPKMSKTIYWSPSEASLGRASRNSMLEGSKQRKLDEMMKAATIGRSSEFGDGWEPPGMVSRKIAELLTSGGRRADDNSQQVTEGVKAALQSLHAQEVTKDLETGRVLSAACESGERLERISERSSATGDPACHPSQLFYAKHAAHGDQLELHAATHGG